MPAVPSLPLAGDRLADVHRRGDRVIRWAIALHLLLALLLAPLHGTWVAALAGGGAAAAAFMLAAWRWPGASGTRVTAGLALQAFGALAVHQLHGQPEAHFLAFTAVTVLLVYQDWRCLWPGVLALVVLHLVLAALQNRGLVSPYFHEPAVTWGLLGPHLLLVLLQAAVASVFADALRRGTERRLDLADALAAERRELGAHLAALERAHAALSESEERQRLVLQATDDGVWDCDLTTGRVWFSDRWCAMLGYERHELAPTMQAWAALIHPDDRGAAHDFMVAHLKGVASTREHAYRLRTRRGSWRWVLGRGSVVARDGSGRALRAVGTHTDISARRETETRLHALFQSSPLAIVTLTADGRVLSWNPEAERLFGWRAAEVLDRPLPTLAGAGEAAEAQDLLGRVLRGERIAGLELRRHHKDGRAVDVAVSAAPIEDASGRVSSVQVIYLDVTARRAAEARLRQSYEEVERAWRRAAEQAEELARLNGELDQARTRALESVRLKSEFLANMSHEIRTPLNAIVGFADLMLETGLDAAQREFAETTRSAAYSLLGIIDDILDFSKLEAGQLQLDPHPFDLGALVEEVAELLAPRAAEKGLELVLRTAPGTPMRLVGDAKRVRQVLVNLVGNAVKFTERGHVLLDIAGEPVAGGRARMCFTVSDTGIGIPEAQRERIFGKFTQADGSTSRRFGGTGLGLSISRQLARLHGGELTLTSEVGAGSTFCFDITLPCEPEPAVAPPAGPAPRVLVAVEYPLARRVLAEALAAQGLEVEACAGADEALRHLRASRAAADGSDLVIVSAPRRDALSPELVAACPVPLVLLAASDQYARRDRWFAAGASAVLRAPFRRADLEAITALAREQAARRGGGASPAAAAPAARCRVLLCEDHPANRAVALEMLKRLGCDVEVAEDGQAGVQAWSTGRFDVVLMDCHMPGTDGFAATAEIRRREGAGRRTPIVAVTALAMDGDRERCLAAGMDDYLRKPVRKHELAAVLARWAPQAPASAA